MGNEAEYRTICGLADRGQLWPDVDVVVPLADAASAFQRLRDGVQLGKVVIEVR
jgi:D-arabinose 1-dehydrogenase-like Zn-dependent alcohol dehydrogenase